MVLDWNDLIKSAINSLFVGMGTSLGIYVTGRYLVKVFEIKKMNGNGKKKADDDKEV